MSLPPVPPSPGFSRRSKAGKAHPTLPLSAFTPPNSSASERFPLPPSPSTILPEKVIDANVILSPSVGGAKEGLAQWKREVESVSGSAERIGGVVVSLVGVETGDIEKTLAELKSASGDIPILSVLVPFSLDSGVPITPPSYLPIPASSASHPKIVLSATYKEFSEPGTEALKWAFTNGYSVDLDVQVNIREEKEKFEDFLNALLLPDQNSKTNGKVILSNLLPPQDDFSLEIWKLLTHPTYEDYQSRMASISLNSNVFVKFQPPMWDVPTPPTPAPPGVPTSASSDSSYQKDTFEKKEWKKRIKMYLGPALEAFGYERIIYGSSPSPASHASSNAGDWYELARESFAELGVEQEGIDAIFYGNAKLAYS